MRRAWPLLVALAIAGVVGPAQAQGGGSVIAIGNPGGKIVSLITMPARARGALVVAFHGDAAAGCAAHGLCAYSGTVVVRPRLGGIQVATYRRSGAIRHRVTVLLNFGQSADTTFARVQRSASAGSGGTCADAAGESLGELPSRIDPGNSVTIKLLGSGGSLLQTRCAGPLDVDLGAASPAVTLPLSRLLRGRSALDLTGTRAFSTHGFAGTITSTVTVALGKAKSQPLNVNPPAGIKIQRIRTVTEHLRLVGVRGRLGAAVRGTGNPIVCALLDTCGLTGTLSLSGGLHAATAEVVAQGPARRPYRDLLTALGLSRGGRSRGIGVTLFVNWTSDVHAQISQAGAVCTDTAPTGTVSLGVGVGQGGSGQFGGFGGFAASWRTRCPGPLLGGATLVPSGSLSRSALGRGRFGVTLRAAGRLLDDGFVVTPRGRLKLDLRRGPITQQVFASGWTAYAPP